MEIAEFISYQFLITMITKLSSHDLRHYVTRLSHIEQFTEITVQNL